jgi:hypothetical protein
MREDTMSAHRFRWLAGMVAAVIGLLLWQNWMLRAELRRLNNHVEEAVATAEDASEYARRSWDAADSKPEVAPIPAYDHPIHNTAIPLPNADSGARD